MGKLNSFIAILLLVGVSFGADDYSTWAKKKTLYLDATATGANVATTTPEFPVLVRLTSSNFDFSQALGNGEDIRFADSDGDHLFYEIGRWDSTNALADIWVLADSVVGNDTTTLTMYWNKAGAADSSNPQAVFDTANGFVGVWHLDTNVNNVADGYKDATYNAKHGTGPNMGLSRASGIIGYAQDFGGASSGDTISVDGTGKMNFNAPVTIAAWVKSDNGSGNNIWYASKGSNSWDTRGFGAYSSKWLWNHCCGSSDLSNTAPTSNWTYLVWSLAGDTASMFVDAVFDTAWDTTTYGSSGGTGGDENFRMGGGPIGAETEVWDGLIDETRISKTRRSDDWIKLCYENQQATQTLVTYGATENNIGASIVWQGDSTTAWSLAENWVGDVVPSSLDTATFNSTASGNCVVDVSVDVASISCDNTFDQDFDQNGQTITTSGGITFNGDGTNTVTLDAAITITGDASLTWESGVGTLTATSCDVDLQGTGSLVSNKQIVMRSVKCAYSGKTTTHSGSAYLIINGAANPLISFEGGTFTQQRTLILQPTATVDLYTSGATTHTGVQDWLIQLAANSIEVTLPAATFTQNLKLYNSGTRTGCSYRVSGVLQSAQFYMMPVSNSSITYHLDSSLTTTSICSIAPALGSTATVNFGSSTHDFDRFEANSAGTTTVNAQTSKLQVAGNFTLGTNTNWVPNADTLELDGTGAQAVTLGNLDTIGTLIINKASGTASTAQSLGALNFDLQAGTFDISGDTIFVSGGTGVTQTGVTFTSDASSAVSFSICNGYTKNGVAWPTIIEPAGCASARRFMKKTGLYIGL